MKRIGIVLVILLLVSAYSCGEKDTEEVKQTGLELNFTNCITFAVWLWIDGEYQGTYTSDESNFIPLSAGSHSLYAQSNLVLTETNEYFCWSKDFNVKDGEIAYMTLDCEGNTCRDTLSTSSW